MKHIPRENSSVQILQNNSFRTNAYTHAHTRVHEISSIFCACLHTAMRRRISSGRWMTTNDPRPSIRRYKILLSTVRRRLSRGIHLVGTKKKKSEKNKKSKKNTVCKRLRRRRFVSGFRRVGRRE